MTATDPFGWVGSIIDGQFAVEAVAGEGAFGVVYRGTHLGFEVPIAIKCLKISSDLGDERGEFVSRFRDEARLLHRLSRLTTSVVQALHVGSATGPSGRWAPYIVMEWLEGETLEENLRRRRAEGFGLRGLDEAIDLLTPAADALAIAHAENVSHRDVKPANLFLSKSRSGSPLKVLDFGVAKVFADTPSLTAANAQTGEGFRPFTPQYGAPEQFYPGYGATGPWTDVFAMALVLIEVASGRPALVGGDLLQLFASAGDERHRPNLSERGIVASRAVDAVLARALAVSPALRFPDLGTMWAAVLAARREPLPALARAASAGARSPDAARAVEIIDAASSHAENSARPPLESLVDENRQCTVMFVDLSDVIGFSGRIGPEEVKGILDRCFRAVEEHVGAMGGFIESPTGGRVMATFGLPRATESDAERAVAAALRIQTAIGHIPLPRSLRTVARLSARIGIATGRVFVESLGGAAKHDFAVSGDAVHAAARLQQAAARSTIVIGRDTNRQTAGRFDLKPIASVEVAEGGEALQAYVVLSPTAFRQSLSSPDFYGIETALVGRGAEQRRLLEAFETVLSESQAKLVTLVGPPGVGRSRLLADLASTLRDRPALVLAAQCSPLAKDTSYGLAALLIRSSFEIHEGDAPDVVHRKLRSGTRWLRLVHRRTSGAGAGLGLDRAELDDMVTQIAAVLGAHPAGRTDAMIRDEASNLAKPRIAAAFVRLIGLVTARVSLTVLCDDIQWADDASLDLVGAIVARAERLPILLVCSARPELDEQRPRWGVEQATHERIHVAPLPRRYIEAMIGDRLRLTEGLAREVVATLADRAEGNPLTLVETLHLLVDAGVVEVTRDGPWRVHQEKLGTLALPATIQGIVQARLDRLDPEARIALERAAVIGRTYWEGALDRLRREGGRATSVTSGDLLTELRSRQLIRARDPSTLPGEREYFFAESATQEVAYEMLSAKLRRTLHLLVAQWLETRVNGYAGAALLALHHDRGGDLARAAAEYARAAVHAASLGENAEALRFLTRARQIHDESEAFDTEDGSAESVEERRIARWIDRVRLRLELGDVLRRVGRLDEAERTYGEARVRILRAERRGTVSIEPLDASLWDARVDFRLAHVHRQRGATTQALRLVESAIHRALESDAADETPPMYAMLAFLHRRERRPHASFEAARQGLRVCRAARQRDERWREDVAQLLFGIGAALNARGRMIGMERSYQQALRAINEAKQPHLAGVALNGIAVARLTRGEVRGVSELFGRSLRLKERVGDLHQIAIACNNLAEVELRLQNVPAALEHAQRSVRLGEQVSAGYDLADFYRNLSEAWLAAGDVEASLAAGQRALAIGETTGRVYLGDVAVSLARVCVHASGAGEEALRGRAVEVAKILSASLSKHFEDEELHRKADECRILLARVLIESPITPPTPDGG